MTGTEVAGMLAGVPAGVVAGVSELGTGAGVLGAGTGVVVSTGWLEVET
jgi:hypothetical protein